MLELDGAAQIISYEEYYPYGSTSYQAVNKAVKVAAKRYRYTGKERDEASGLYYHGARYYAPWLGRWTTPTPIGIADGPMVYSYVSKNPIMYNDHRGTNGEQMSLIESIKIQTVALRHEFAHAKSIRDYIAILKHMWMEPRQFVAGHSPGTPHY